MIYFVRHGATDWNENRNAFGEKDPKCQGRVDLPLNKKGVNEAEQTALELKGIKFDRVLCSPLLRAKQTCEIIYHGKTPVEIDERLIERDFGEFEGLTRKEFDFAGYWNANGNQKFVKAESIKDVEKRVFDLLNELNQHPNENVLLVSHGGVGCVLMTYFNGIPKDGNYLTFEMPHGKPQKVDFANLKENLNFKN